MAVVIRMRRTGRKNRPCYRFNVTDSRFPRDGRHLETVGIYDPIRRDKGAQVVVDLERVQFWLSHGAKASETVTAILKRQGFRVPTPTKRRPRPGRSKTTATRTQRESANAARAEAKLARSTARKAVKRAVKKAAPAEAPQA
jgi:small subunit ribosomal protein S16